MGPGVQVMLDVVAIVEGDGIVAAGNAVVRHAIGAARGFRVDKHVLAPARLHTESLPLGAPLCDLQALEEQQNCRMGS